MGIGLLVGGGKRGVGFLIIKCGFADTDWSKSLENKAWLRYAYSSG